MHLVPNPVTDLNEYREQRRRCPRLAEINPRDFDYRTILLDWAVEENALRHEHTNDLPPAA